MPRRRRTGSARGVLIARQLGQSQRAERDEWRGYFDRMLEWLHHFGYTAERNPWSMLLTGPTSGPGASDQGAS
jgi:hypothetical protein